MENIVIDKKQLLFDTFTILAYVFYTISKLHSTVNEVIKQACYSCVVDE